MTPWWLIIHMDPAVPFEEAFGCWFRGLSTFAGSMWVHSWIPRPSKYPQWFEYFYPFFGYSEALGNDIENVYIYIYLSLSLSLCIYIYIYMYIFKNIWNSSSNIYNTCIYIYIYIYICMWYVVFDEILYMIFKELPSYPQWVPWCHASGVRRGISQAWSMSPSATSDSQRRTTRPHRKPKRSGKLGEYHGNINEISLDN